MTQAHRNAITVVEAEHRLRLMFGRGAELRLVDHESDGLCHVEVVRGTVTARGPDAPGFEAAVIGILWPERVESRR